MGGYHEVVTCEYEVEWSVLQEYPDKLLVFEPRIESNNNPALRGDRELLRGF